MTAVNLQQKIVLVTTGIAGWPLAQLYPTREPAGEYALVARKGGWNTHGVGVTVPTKLAERIIERPTQDAFDEAIIRTARPVSSLGKSDASSWTLAQVMATLDARVAGGPVLPNRESNDSLLRKAAGTALGELGF
jgi:hypothetical protein